MTSIVDALRNSEIPSIQYKILVNVLGRRPDGPEARQCQANIPGSDLVKSLLSERDAGGRIPLKAYSKWRGAHWVLAALADLDYPAGDDSLIPLREQVLDWLFSGEHQDYFSTRTVAGKVRMHPSQEGNAIYALVKLGLADERVDSLVKRILSWRWPDGGWNCDMNPAVEISSFHESLIPLRGLIYYQELSGDDSLKETIEETAEIFLKRRLYKRLRDGAVMNTNFTALHYPCYWHYDMLFGLKVITEAGLVHDPRCADALALLESKRLPDGGFPAEKKYYRAAEKQTGGSSTVDWGGTSKKHSNVFITADALYVLKSAGRISV